jgi:hypothetical protein
MGKLPGFVFYPGDWLKDPELRRCSKAEKGVWIDMLAVSFECSDRGVFATGGVPWTDEEISAAIGGDTAENLKCLRELLRKGVARRNQSGAIFSARMVRDESNRAAERTKKQNQRFREKCPDVVPPSVPPLSVNESEREVVPEVVVLKPKTKTIEARFELDDFDGQFEFQRLCQVHPQAEDGIQTQNLWTQTIERELRPGQNRRDIADRIHECAIAYRNCNRRITYGLSSWLTKGIWKQGVAIWEEKSVAGTAKQRALSNAIDEAFS